MNKNVTILSFSERNSGNCAAISRFLEHYYMQTNVRSYTIDSKNFAPCGGCDYECLKPNSVCPRLTQPQHEVMDRICCDDLVYFIVPNYCGYPCANYFAFNERSVGYFNLNRNRMDQYMSVPKRFIVVSNTAGDPFRAAMSQQTAKEPDILYLQSSKYHKRSIAGDLLESEAVKADLEAFLRIRPI